MASIIAYGIPVDGSLIASPRVLYTVWALSNMTMRCTNCQSELIAGKAFCTVCGARVAQNCASCGAILSESFRFCPDCGTEVRQVATLSTPDQIVVAADQQPVSVIAPVAAPAVPDAVTPQPGSALIATTGERKQVTVLFCDLAGSTALAGRLDPEEYHDLLDEYLELAFRAVYDHEGIVNQLAGDGFMALFGAPVAHEDAPQRAVQAALDIQQALQTRNAGFDTTGELDLRARIGIHTGPVVVGSVGNDLKMDYSAIGDTTNLAAGLEALARPGAVLVSEATWRLIRARFLGRRVGPLKIKGKTQPIPAYEILGLTEAARAEPSAPIAIGADRALTPFVGRTAELAQLLDCYARLHEFLPQLAVVVGPAGSGKSRLIHEFRQHLRDEPVTWFEVRCSAWTQSVPFAPFAGMLRRYLEVNQEQAATEVRERIANKVRPWDPELSEHYPWLCRMLAVADDATMELSDEELKRGTFNAMGALMYHATESGPVIMLIEDAHWMDELSLEMLYAAASEMYTWPFMLLVTHRHEFRPAWGTQPVMTQFNLRRLTDDSITEIMRNHCGGPLPGELEARIREKAEGSPFLAEEITRALIEDGTIDCDADTKCIAHVVDELRIPGTVQEVIAARLDRLSPNAKRVVQIAAVIGRQFDRKLLVDLLSEEAIDVDIELDGLEQRGVIHRRNIFSKDEYRFGESLTQEVAYEGLLLRQRRQIHEHIGVLLEQRGETADGERSALLMHHFGLSDNRAKSMQAHLRSASEAEKVPSYVAAARFYRQAWDIAESAPDLAGDSPLQTLALQAVVGIGRMTVIYSVADTGDNERIFAQARAIAERKQDVGTLAALHTYEGMLLMQHGREAFPTGLATVQAGLILAQQSPDPLVTVANQRALAYGFMLDGRLAEAEQTLDSMLDQLTAGGHAERITDIYLSSRWMRDRVYFLNDELDRSASSAHETMALAVRAGNRTIRSSATALIAQIALNREEYADTLRWAEAAFSVISTIGPHINGAVTAALALLASHALGLRDGLRRYIDFINQNATPLNDLALNANIVTEALLIAGEIAIAERRAALAHARAGGRLREVQALLAMGAVHFRRGAHHWADAERCFSQSLVLANTLGMRSTGAHALAGSAELAAVRGRTTDALRLFQQAADIWHELGMSRYQQQVQGRLADLVEDSGAAA